jgi:hypothetical protein
MRLGIMQPYFFPHLGHFALIAAVDEWIVFDITQYTRKSWINRNRVLHPTTSWQYISMPLATSSIHIKIAEAKVANSADQEQYVLGKVSHYKKRAPYYAQVCGLIERTFAGIVDDSLVSLNVSGLRAVCAYLGLPFRYRICSELALEFPENCAAGEWAPWLSKKLSADVYINPVGGQELFDPTDFTSKGVQLQFLDFTPFAYETPGYGFEPSLSILDVLMWNSPDTVLQAIRSNSVLRSAPVEAGAG